jgi:REP element-mobilizing transposase RayT
MNDEFPRRKNIRLPGYDYSQAGYYFITICTQNRTHLFGDISAQGDFVENEFGRILAATWLDLPNHNARLGVDKFVVMPNHFHGIVIIEEKCGLTVESLDLQSRAGLEPAPTMGHGLEPAPTILAEVVRQLKTFSAKRINARRNTPGTGIWQRGYYEHILRGEQDYQRIWQYIDENPIQWALDQYYQP